MYCYDAVYPLQQVSQSSTSEAIPRIIIKHLVHIDFIIVYGRHKVSKHHTITKPGMDM